MLQAEFIVEQAKILSEIFLVHAEILAEHVSSLARQNEKLYKVMKLIVSKFGVIEDPSGMPSSYYLKYDHHTPPSTSLIQS